MDIDLSKVVLILLAVLPGYLARRGNDQVIPRTLRPKGATEEIAEFLILSAAAHLILTIAYGVFWSIAGLWLAHSTTFFTHEWTELSSSGALKKFSELPFLQVVFYLFLSMVAGWFLGLFRGLVDAWQVYDLTVEKLGRVAPGLYRFWQMYYKRFLITGRPIIYKAMFPDLDENGDPKSVYALIVLKDNQGTVTGRVASFSIANDEESHKLVYLENVYKMNSETLAYEKPDVDGMLVDIADAITVQIKQV